MADDIASALFGVDGLRVVEAESEVDGTLTVWAVTGHPGVAVCPGCGTRAGRVHEQVLGRPRTGIGSGCSRRSKAARVH